jgi:hypothetical protein
LVTIALPELEIATPATMGFIRTVIAPGGSINIAAGTAPAVRYVESGSIGVVVPSDSLPPMVVQAATDSAADSPTAGTDSDLALGPGDALVIPAGGVEWDAALRGYI